MNAETHKQTFTFLTTFFLKKAYVLGAGELVSRAVRVPAVQEDLRSNPQHPG